MSLSTGRFAGAAFALVGVAMFASLVWKTDADPVAIAHYQGKSELPGVAAASPEQVQSNPAPVQTASSTQQNESKFDTVERLLRSGDSVQAFAALKILDRCARSQSAEREAKASSHPVAHQMASRMFGEPKDSCGNLIASQLAQRPQLALQAANAGIPGAYGMAIQLVNENPDYTELQASLESIIAKGIAAADPLVLSTQAHAYANCPDPPKCTGMDLYKAFKYLTAYRIVRDLKNPDPLLTFLEQKLGSDLARAAADEGRQLVIDARAKAPGN